MNKPLILKWLVTGICAFGLTIQAEQQDGFILRGLNKADKLVAPLQYQFPGEKKLELWFEEFRSEIEELWRVLPEYRTPSQLFEPPREFKFEDLYERNHIDYSDGFLIAWPNPSVKPNLDAMWRKTRSQPNKWRPASNSILLPRDIPSSRIHSINCGPEPHKF